jgi:Ca2+-binding EF-hand superfamily protein
MKKLASALVVLGLVIALPAAASAQDGKKKGERHAKKREALLKKFDKDGDGKLNEQERKAAREFKAKRRGDEGRDRKGPHRRALRKFDKDGNRKLDREERRDFRKFRQDRREKKGRR